MASEFDVDGLKELEKALVALEGTVATKELRRAMMYATKPTVDLMKAKVPIGDGVGGSYKSNSKSGDTKKSIKRRFKKSNGKFAAEIEVGPRGKLSWKAHWVEFGVQPHYVSKGSKVGKSKSTDSKMHPGHKPHPFVRPAFYQTQHIMVNRFKEKLAENLDKTAKANAKGAK